MRTTLALFAIALSVLPLACNGDSGGASPMPTVSNYTQEGTLGVSPRSCLPYSGEGDVLTLTPQNGGLRAICEHSLCVVDEVCYYGCPAEMVPAVCQVGG